MKILMTSYSGYGAWYTLRLQEEGHQVDYYLQSRKYKNVLRGIAPAPIFAKPDFGKYDLVLFDLTGRPKLAEEAIKLAPTIGDGEFHSLVEEDRMYGVKVMEMCEIPVPPYEEFTDLGVAKQFIRKTKKRYVFKPDGGQDQDSCTTYVSQNWEDLLEYIDRLSQSTKGAKFILQEVVEGIEVSLNGYFNGEDFYHLCVTLEEKKFMEGNKGPNTGCSGNMIFPVQKSCKLYQEGLMKLIPFLKGIDFHGPIDLNTIVGDNTIYGLEWTPRFGYDSTSSEMALITSDMGEFLYDIATGGNPDGRLIVKENSYAAGVRISIPPYPTEIDGMHPDGVPIKGIEPEDVARHFYLYDAMLDSNDLVTAGASGFVVVPIGVGSSPEEAWDCVKKRTRCIRIPDMQYRQDMYKCTKIRHESLSRWGWLKG